MRVIVSITIALQVACNSNPESCKITCTEDTECPNGLTCGDLGRCTAGELCTEGTCEAATFLGCIDDATARFCNSDGTGVAGNECGGFGCNPIAARCNECSPDQLACVSGDLTTCSDEGLIASTETCTLQCAEPTGQSAARCRRIVPVWIPEACDVVATEAELLIDVATEIDTNNDLICTGGVVAQPSGPEICIVRYRKITLGASVSVVGSRVVAFVADQALDVDGVLDVGARASVSGPGVSGGTSGGVSATGGGGGAGFRQVGGKGGSFGVGGGVGGTIVDPLASPILSGGLRAASNSVVIELGDRVPHGGGGGGAALLVSCTGAVTVTGTIDAGGGGGTGGGRKTNLQGSPFLGGAGGGSGGYVVLQGAVVVVTGGLFSNGGGGGGGCNCSAGEAGQDGAVAGVGGAGGAGVAAGAQGGIGGIGTVGPTAGTNTSTSGAAGGGGGSVGRFQVYTAEGSAPVLNPTVAQPPFEPNLTLPTR